MKRLALCLLVALLPSAATDARKPRSTLRVHLEANPRDGASFAVPVRAPFSGRTVVIEKTPTITERDVVAFYPYAAADGTFGALFQLNDHGKLALDTLSIERRGKTAFVVINGRPVAELQIDRRVSDGKLYVASGLTQADLALMKKDWRVIGQRKK